MLPPYAKKVIMQKKPLKDLLQELEQELLRLGYTEGSMKFYRNYEQNFGFLKDPVIVNSIFLKKSERIEVLGMVLLLSLLIWRFLERAMRNFIEKTGEDLPGWKNRRMRKPTSFMPGTKFAGEYLKSTEKGG